ncbi:MAG: MaoC family dehydratase N-terminal domain-containing protein [Pseudomonadota bacterium]
MSEADLQAWVGKTEIRHDIVSAGPVQRLQAVFDVVPDAKDGTPLPPLFHWLYFLETARQSDLGPDGHPKLGNFLPPVSAPPLNLTRRMWAGARLKFLGALLIGEPVKRISTIRSVAFKQGRSGPLCFVTVEHMIAGEHSGGVIEEQHDIVYRSPDQTSHNQPVHAAPTLIAPHQSNVDQSTLAQTIVPSEVMLFRYSALTFNGHRIHYDRDYCRSVEGYPGLVFHGPLTATLLARLACQANAGKAMTAFSFKARAPLYDPHPFTLHGEAYGTFTAKTPEGQVAMEASAEFEC